MAPTCRRVCASSGANALRPRAVIESSVCRASAGRHLLADQPILVEAAQDAAQIAGIKTELAADVARGRTRALPDFVEHPRLGERERAVEPGFLQQADVLGVEAVEAAHRGDAIWHAAFPLILAGRGGHAHRLGQLVD